MRTFTTKGTKGTKRAWGLPVVSLVCFVSFVVVPSLPFAQSLVIAVRHAERADGGSGTSMSQTDPLLSAEGEARAKRLAAMLADAGITAIFVTEYKRTQDTAKPIAQKIGVEARTHKAQDSAGLAAALKANHAKDVVLVIGHSNTLPAVIKALGGPEWTIPDAEYDAIYIFVPATGVLTKIRY
jgi:broad specificity phosphatase PhoE